MISCTKKKLKMYRVKPFLDFDLENLVLAGGMYKVRSQYLTNTDSQTSSKSEETITDKDVAEKLIKEQEDLIKKLDSLIAKFSNVNLQDKQQTTCCNVTAIPSGAPSRLCLQVHPNSMIFQAIKAINEAFGARFAIRVYCHSTLECSNEIRSAWLGLANFADSFCGVDIILKNIAQATLFTKKSGKIEGELLVLHNFLSQLTKKLPEQKQKYFGDEATSERFAQSLIALQNSLNLRESVEVAFKELESYDSNLIGISLISKAYETTLIRL